MLTMSAFDSVFCSDLSGGDHHLHHQQQMAMMDELEQKCYDLDAKVRRVEEERDAVMHENDDLQDQVRAHLNYVTQPCDIGHMTI